MLPRLRANARRQVDAAASTAKVELQSVTHTCWDDLVATMPQASLYHTRAWLDLLTHVYGVTWQPLGIWRQGELIGLFPLLTRQLGPFSLAGSPLMQVIGSTPQLGPAVDALYLPAVLAALDQVLFDGQIDHIEMALPFHMADVTPARRLGYQIETEQTVVIPLAGRTTAQLWRGLASAARRAVHKAEASGLTVVEAQTNSGLDTYYQMCEEVYRTAGRPPHLSATFYQAAWQALAAQGKLKLWFVMHHQAIVAGAIFLIHRDTAIYLSGASYDQWLPLRPNNLVQWQFMCWALEHNYRSYDLGGVAVPGITRFKLSLGGQCISYTRLYRANSMLAYVGRAAYQHLIPLWRRWQS